MATEWQNKRGRSMWQPTLPDGRRLWVMTLWGEPYAPEWGWRGEKSDNPSLCGKRRAERIERRRWRKEQRKEMDETYEEVDRG